MKRIISAVAMALVASSAFAEGISREQAAVAARNWLRESPNPMDSGLSAAQVETVDSVADDDGLPLFHAVRLTGGGTVVTSSDTGVEPIIAFGPETLDISPGSPLHALLEEDLRARRAAIAEESPATAGRKAGRVALRVAASADDAADDDATPEAKWARLLGEGESLGGGRSMRAAAAPVTIPSTVKVHPLVGTHWDQGGQHDPDDPDHKNAAMSPYSAFTPCKFPAGCGPVVLAQILAYWDAFGSETGLREEYRKAIYKVPYVVEPGKTNHLERVLFCAKESEGGEGTSYHQNSLPFRCVEFFPEKDNEEIGLDPTKWQPSDFEGQITVGKLLFDCGTLLGSVYSTNGTSTSSADLLAALKNKFHFEKATLKSIGGTFTQSSALSETRNDLAKKRPVIFGLANKAERAKDPESPGHVVIADGYGTVGSTTYYHLNMGWGGSCDAWYCPPNFATGTEESFDVFRYIIYGIRPIYTVTTDPIVIPGYGTIPGSTTTVETGTPPDFAMPTTGFTDDYVRIEWRPFTAGAKYTIQRNQGDSNALQSQWTTVASGIAGENGVEYKDADARPGVKYIYKVSRNGEEMDVGHTGGIHVKSPQNLTAESVDGGIRLTWDAVEGNAGYKIYCSAPKFTEALAAKAPVEYRTVSSTEECTLPLGKTCAGCYFRLVVRAIGKISNDYYLSDMTAGKVHRFGYVGTGPALRVVSKDEKTGKVVFQWNQVAGVDGYEIWSDEGIAASNLRNINTCDEIQTLGTLRVYAIRTFTTDRYGNYEYSEFGPPVEVDMRPALPDFTLSGTTRKVTIRIQKPRANILYKVYRRTGEPTTKEICVGSVKKTSNYQYADVYDSMVTTGVTYYYFVEVVSPSDPKTVWRTDMKSIMLTSDGGGSGNWGYYTGQTTAQYSVALDQQGGSGGTESVTVATGFPMPGIAIPGKSGFDFAGYFTEPEGMGDQYYTASGASARTWPYEHGGTLYAAWTKKTVPLSSIAISGPATVSSAGTATYACTATYSDKSTATVAAEWSLSAGGAYGSIDPATGVFAALSAPAQRTVTVKATFGGKSATKTVTISARALVSLAISGPDEIPSLETASYACTATYGDGTTAALSPTWSLASGGTYATVVKTTGAVTSKNEGSTDVAATLRATSGGKTADKAITLLAKEPPRPTGDLHVDAEKGDDANDGRTWRRAKRTIQGAIDVAVDGELVLVFDGVYGPIDTNGKGIEIRSVNGAEATIIDGGAASRCARLLDTESGFLSLDASTSLVGFTLRNGRSAEDGGGTIGGRLVGCILCDNATEGIGGGAVCAELERCKVLRNRATGSGGGTVFCNLFDCLVAGNVSGDAGGGVFGGPGLSAAGCTIVGNEAATRGGGAVSCYVTNSIVWGNAAPNSADLYGCDEWRICSSVVDPGRGSVAADPLFADPENGDYRLRPESPCIDAGDDGAVRSDVDLAGAPRVRNGRVDLGAYEHRAPWRVVFDARGNGAGSAPAENVPTNGLYYSVPASDVTREGFRFGGWTYADGTPAGSFDDLPAGQTAVYLYADWTPVYRIAFDPNGGTGAMPAVSCAGDETVVLPGCAFSRPGRAFVGWATRPDGPVLYLAGDAASGLTRLPGSTVLLYAFWADSSTTTFADAAGGHASGDGVRSFPTIQEAIDAVPADGTVLVYPGVYGPVDFTDKKGFSPYGEEADYGRRYVLRSILGRDRTVVDGGGAARCATLCDPGVKMIGFTLRNGAADSGGGAKGGTLFDCLVEDCSALSDGGGVHDCFLQRCVVRYCAAGGAGGGAFDTLALNTLFDSNEAGSCGGGTALSPLRFCTVWGNRAPSAAGVAGYSVWSSVVWENRRPDGGLSNYGSWVATDGSWKEKPTFLRTNTSPKPSGKGNFSKNPGFVDPGAGDFRLGASSPCRNKGAVSDLQVPWYLDEFSGVEFPGFEGDLDLDRRPRRSGAPDMGAYEVLDGTPVPADYDGDGVCDAATFDAATATWTLRQSRDGLRVAVFGDAKSLPVPADYDGDGRADFATYSATAKAPAFRIRTLLGAEPVPIALGAKGATPFAADLDGDGLADPIVFQGNAKKPSFTAALSGGGTLSRVFGTKGAKAAAGDFDGDGRADLGCYTASASKPAFAMLLSGNEWNTLKPLRITLGAKGSVPCCGDFDGDGIADFAAYAGSAKTPILYRMLSTSRWSETRSLPFGAKGSLAATGDWDGDGAADPAIETRGVWSRVSRGWTVEEIPAP